MTFLDNVINTYLVVVPEADDEAIPKLGSAPKFPALPPLLLYIVQTSACSLVLKIGRPQFLKQQKNLFQPNDH